jgi:hypothetical protein
LGARPIYASEARVRRGARRTRSRRRDSP